MEPKEFVKDTKPREIFVYTCRRIGEPLFPLGFRYRKSKNDLVKQVGDFTYRIYFQPSIKRGSTCFTVHVAVESDRLEGWRAERLGRKGDRGVFANTLARLTKRQEDWPHYYVSTSLERERTIAEITVQIREFALPFFAKFEHPQQLIGQIQEQGFLPHRKGFYGSQAKQRVREFIDCYTSI